MPPASFPFLAREQELGLLEAAWREVTTGGGPRIAVIVAEAGLGKTRLAQEFYRRLRAVHDIEGYWADSLAQDGDNLRVAPDPATCGAGEPPFLWWGLRLDNPLERNRVGSGALAPGVEDHLLPHLAALQQRKRQRGRGARLAQIGTSLAADLVADAIPFAGMIKSVAEAGLELKQLHDDWRGDQAPLGAEAAGSARRENLIETVLASLHDYFATDRPGVVLINDAQFSHSDPGMVAFIQALLERARACGWPLLLLVTHWEQEWAAAHGNTIAGVLQAGQAAVVQLGAIDDLRAMVRAMLPGVSDAHAAALSARAGGNPRFLEEMLRTATSLRGRRWFEGRDASRDLTEDGLAELLRESVDLHDIVLGRIEASPDSVQRALTLASAQGSRFLQEVLVRVAERLEGERAAVELGVRAAGDPHAFLTGTLDEFRQPIYYEVARELLPALYDKAEARAALKDVVREVLQEGDHGGPDLHGLAAALFEDAEASADRALAAASLHALLVRAVDDYDHHAMALLVRRAAAVLQGIDDGDLGDDHAWLRAVSHVMHVCDLHDEREPVLERLLRLARQGSGPHAQLVLADALKQEGDAAWRRRGGGAVMPPEWTEAFELLRETNAADNLGRRAQLRAELAVRIAAILREAGRADEAEPYVRQALAGEIEGVSGLRSALQLLLAEIVADHGDDAEYRELVTAAIADLRRLKEAEATSRYDRSLARALRLLDASVAREGDQEQGLRLLTEVVQLCRGTVAAAATDTARLLLADYLGSLAGRQLSLRMHAEAYDTVQEAIAEIGAIPVERRDAIVEDMLTGTLLMAAQAASRFGDREGGEQVAWLALQRVRAEPPGRSPAGTARHLESLAAYLLYAIGYGADSVDQLLAEADSIRAGFDHPRLRLIAVSMSEIERLRAIHLERAGDSEGAATARRREAEYWAATGYSDERVGGG